jgi:hypothetical protein
VVEAEPELEAGEEMEAADGVEETLTQETVAESTEAVAAES